MTFGTARASSAARRAASRDEEIGSGKMNYVRNVEFHVKAGKTPEFNRTFADTVIPVLKQQAGFKHELAMSNEEHVLGISVWKDQASADQYESKVYPELLKKLTPLIDGSPRSEGFELTASTVVI